MSISGVLEDLPLADVLQFIHLGRRTGTLHLWQSGRRRAEIVFVRGRILDASAPGQAGLGEELVSRRAIGQEDLDRALLRRQEATGAPTLGELFLDDGVPREEILEAVRSRVEGAILELVQWRQGEFHFEVDEVAPPRDLGGDPERLLGDLDLNTQRLLLEAIRICDEAERGAADAATEGRTALERHLQRAGFSSQGRTEPILADDEREEAGQPDLPPEDEGPPLAELLRCQVVSDDPRLVGRLRSHLPASQVRVTSVQVRDAAHRVPGEMSSPILVLDGRTDEGELLDRVAALARTRPGCPVLFLAADDETCRHALDGGAVGAFLHVGDLVRVCRNLVRIHLHRPRTVEARSLGTFRQVVFDVQAGMSSATMALNLMHVISDSVERAVLFLVQGEALEAVGAFGFAQDGEPLARSTRGLRIVPPLGPTFRGALADPEPRSSGWEEAELPPTLAELLGRPRSGQVVVFPVPGTERTISLIYTDNGERDEKIEDLRILQLATAQVGAAFENELIGRQLGQVVWGVDDAADE